ncbi:NAD-aldehyde dehydrogenase [Flagelloscypha sp. PMI_526]|nr:NAD-aldehyde dehydrogenase [Flagelloscypha sp. PMI_526]
MHTLWRLLEQIILFVFVGFEASIRGRAPPSKARSVFRRRRALNIRPFSSCHRVVSYANMFLRSRAAVARIALPRSTPSARALSSRASLVLDRLGLLTTSGEHFGVYDGEWKGSGPLMVSQCPSTGEVLGRVRSATAQELDQLLDKSEEAFKFWRGVPAPKRGEVVRQIREALANKADALGSLISLEMGKIKTEGVGEVREFIDICDFAVGLSRRMNGEYVASERPGHSILEVPNPLGVVGVLTAFNFPCAVHGWNLALSMTAGNATIWKPAPSTPLIAVAVTKIIAEILEQNQLPGAIASLAVGGSDIGSALVDSSRIPLISFTGSENVGRQVGQKVAGRFGKSILELGGNNATIIMPDADLSLAIPAVCFGAIGTAGQRCTSTRRLYLHAKIADEFLSRLTSMYKSIKPGDPLVSETIYGPVHGQKALQVYSSAIERLRTNGAEVVTGGRKYELEGSLKDGFFVEPTIAVPKSPQDDVWQNEMFAPILNVAVFDELQQAIEWNNAVPQGLSSSLWTRDLRHMGTFIGPHGSDCGIANINVGTSGAEIGAAFGGNKSTGWGRESGGDAWKQYVRWSACTINFGDTLELAQGVQFNS